VRWDPAAFPRAHRAAFDESIWLPHELFLGGEREIDDLVEALARIQSHAGELRARPPQGPVSRR
jgi:transposase